MNAIGYQPQLIYNISLCYFKMKQYPAALKEIVQIIERGIREHPGTVSTALRVSRFVR